MQYAIKLYDLQNDAYDKGLERGRQENAIVTATKLKRQHKMSDQEIADVTELSLEQVKAIHI